MDILINGRNLHVNEKLQTYVEKKVQRLERYMPNIGEVRVDLSDVNAASAEERLVAQLTVRNERGKVLRAEERSSDIMAAVDAAVDKLSRQVERYKGKGKRRRRGKGLSAEEQIEAYEAELEAESDLAEGAEIVRRKRFLVTPMNEAEAIEQLELLDHDFFLYYNPDTATINVVYRRKGGGYGVLEPELN
jgi:putative sigma-54 modulation protein